MGGGGACTGWVASDTTTQGAQLAENDGLYTCQSSAWVPETLVVGSVLQNGAAPTCSSATAGMLYYTGGTVEYCNGTTFTSFAAGASVALSSITAAVGSQHDRQQHQRAGVELGAGATRHTAFTFGESAATTGASKLVDITTAGGSTAMPLTITNGATSANPVSINMSRAASPSAAPISCVCPMRTPPASRSARSRLQSECNQPLQRRRRLRGRSVHQLRYLQRCYRPYCYGRRLCHAADGQCTTATAETCTGVPASTSVAVNCSGASAFTTSGTTTVYARANGTVNSITMNTTVANSVAMTYHCFWAE